LSAPHASLALPSEKERQIYSNIYYIEEDRGCGTQRKLRRRKTRKDFALTSILLLLEIIVINAL